MRIISENESKLGEYGELLAKIIIIIIEIGINLGVSRTNSYRFIRCLS